MDNLRIAAFDSDDLEVISAHLQDAIVRIGDINFTPKTRQFVLVANRFAWEEAANTKKGLRKRTGVMFAGVSSAKSQKIKQGVPEAVVNLLSIEFVAGKELPAGIIKLMFSGGGIVELDVECVEVVMEDLGPRWETGNVPKHDGADDGPNNDVEEQE